MENKMSDQNSQISLETGSYKPDDLETGSHKPDNLETGSHKPESECLVYPGSLRSAMIFRKLPAIRSAPETLDDLFEEVDTVEDVFNYRLFTPGSFYSVFMMQHDYIVRRYVSTIEYYDTVIVPAPQWINVSPFSRISTNSDLPCCYYEPERRYYLPSMQHHMQDLSLCPNISFGSSLKALAARKLIPWPTSWKTTPAQICVTGFIDVAKVEGNFHYIRLHSDGLQIVIQATDYELYCLNAHNPRVFGAIAARLDGQSYSFSIRKNLFLAPCLHFVLKGLPEAAWAYLLYGYSKVNQCLMAYNDEDNVFYQNMLDVLESFPKMMAWKRRNFVRFSKYWKDEAILVDVDERHLPRRLPADFEVLYARLQRAKKDLDSVTLQGDDVTLHGLPFGNWFGKTQGTDLPSLFTSVKNLGCLSGNINKLVDSMQKPPFDFLISMLTECSTIVVGIFRDFAFFLKDPASFVGTLMEEVASFGEIQAPVSLGEGLLSLGCYVLSYMTFESNPVMSVSMFFANVYTTCCKFTPNKDVARKMAILFSMMYLCVMKVFQSLSTSISLQGPSTITAPLVTACAGIACLIAGVRTYGTSHGIFEYLGKNTKDIMIMSRGTLSLVTCLEFILTTISKGLEYLVGETTMYRTLVKCVVTNEDLKEYIVYSMTKTKEILSTTLTMDETARKEWEKMCKLHNHFLTVFASGKPPTETHIGYSMYSKAFNQFSSLKEEYTKIKDSLDYFRPEPFMIWIWGTPGTGKTWCRDSLVNNLYSWHKKVDPTIPDAKVSGLLYVRNPADKFMSNYTGQFGIGYDDVGQNRQSDNPEFNEIMSIGSTNQVRLNMADINEKGRLFSSKVVIMAANTPAVDANQLLLTEEAFNRRRHVVIEVIRPKVNSSSLVTSQCDFTQVALSLTDPRSGAHVIRFPKQGFGPSAETWMTFYRWLAPRYVEHVKTQKRLLEVKMQQLSATTSGSSSEEIYDYEEEESDFEDAPEAPIIPPVDHDVVTQGESDETLQSLLVEPPFNLARQRRFLKGIKNKMDRFNLATMIYRELCDAYVTYKVIGSDLAKENLRKTYRELLREELDPALFLTPLSIPSITPEQLQSAWELYVETKDKVDYPWLKYLTWSGIVVALFGAYKMYKMVSSGEDLTDVQSYSQSPQAPPKNQVEINKYDTQPLAPGKNQVIIQSVTEDLLKMYKRSIFRAHCIALINGAPRERSINFIQIAYDIFLAPKHFFTGMTEFKFELTNDVTTYPEVEILPSNMTPLDDLDFYLIRIPQVNFGKNLLAHFPTRDEVKAAVTFRPLVISWNKAQKMTQLNYMEDAKRWDIPVNVDHEGTLICFPQGYQYSWDAVPGDCGSLLVSRDNTCCSKLMGVHFGYNGSKRKALSVILTRERLAPYIDRLAPVKIEVTNPMITVEPSEVPASLRCQSSDRPVFEYLGRVKDAPSQPRVHKNLFRSPTYGQIYPPVKDLSVLSQNDPRMDEEFRGEPDILVRGVRDFHYETRSWPFYAMDFGKSCLRYEFGRYRERLPREVCSLEWAINGTWCGDARLEYTEPLRLDTSSGYGLDGKKLRHFDVTDAKCIKISNPKLQSMVDSQWTSWMEGKTYPCIWTHATKSEPLKLSKIVNGNTRTFCVAQTAFLLNVKRLFGAWITAMKSSKIETFSCLGIDPESGDWTDLYNELRSVSSYGIDMDFFKFDRTAVSWQLAAAVVSEINYWYDDDEQYKVARYIAMDDMIHSYCLVGEHLTRKNRGNPSGNPITTELNNCINFLMLSMVYAIVARKYSLGDFSPLSFRKKICAKTYGDDIIYAVSLRDMDWFTPERIADVYAYYGVPVTPADKSDNGLKYQKIEELTFLKRSFRPFDHPQFPWQAALSKDSIRSMIDFYRLAPNAGSMQDAVIVNMHQSLEFAYHWGREFFDDHLSKLEKWLAEKGWPPLAVSYDGFDLRYKIKLGIEQN